MIALVLIGVVFWCVYGIVGGVITMLAGAGIGLLWLTAQAAGKREARKMLSSPPTSPPLLPRKRSMPPPIPADAKFQTKRDKNGIPYL